MVRTLPFHGNNMGSTPIKNINFCNLSKNEVKINPFIETFIQHFFKEYISAEKVSDFFNKYKIFKLFLKSSK